MGLFANFSFERGFPSFLINYPKSHDVKAEDFRGKTENKGFTVVTGIEIAKPSGFLLQAGYLTVREKKGNLLIWDSPKEEVLSSLGFFFNLLNG